MLRIEITYTDGKYTRCIYPVIPQVYVTEENQKVWAKYLEKKIHEMMTFETLESCEFKIINQTQIENQRAAEKRAEEARIWQEKKREADYRRRVMERPKISFTKDSHI